MKKKVLHTANIPGVGRIQLVNVTKAKKPKYEPRSSRFAVCDCGNFFSVEDRNTGERLSTHNTEGAAMKARDRATKQWLAERKIV